MGNQVDFLTSISTYIANISITHKYIKENLKIVKASVEDIELVKKITKLDNYVGNLLTLDGLVLKELKSGQDDYEQNFSLEYDIALEEIDGGVVLLSKKRRGYYTSVILNNGDRVFHKFYNEQLEAMDSFINECKNRK